MLLISLPFLQAKEPTLGILKKINSNTKQIFSINNKLHLCTSYGIIGIEKLSQNSNLKTACKKSIVKFYKQNPLVKYYSQNRLHREQMYHLEFKKKECLLFASGEITLSELLLREGFAVLQPFFKDREFHGVYTLAQRNARLERKGLWKSELRRDCIAAIYEK